MSTIEECIRFVSTNADYYSVRPGYKRMNELYTSILAFLVELKELRGYTGDAYVKGYKQGINDFKEKLEEAFAKDVEQKILYGDGDRTEGYCFQRDYNGQFKKAGDANDV